MAEHEKKNLPIFQTDVDWLHRCVLYMRKRQYVHWTTEEAGTNTTA